MTDRTNIAVTPDLDLLIAPHPEGIRLVLTGDMTQIDAPLSTGAVLAAIDAADPEAMRAYLRETAPDFVADTLRPADGRAAEHFDYLEPEQLDAVPEADSPEDVHEHPDRDDPTERAQLDRAWALELAHRLFPHAGSLLAMKVAAWVIDGQQR